MLAVAGLVVLAGCGGSSEDPEVPDQSTEESAGDVRGAASPDAGARDEEGFVIPLEGQARPFPLRPELGEFFALIQEYRTGAARVRIRKHLNLHPEDGQAHFLFAMSYHRERQYNQAIPFFEDAVRFAPQFDNAWYFFGWALYYEGQAVRSRQMFEQHLRFVPDADDSHFGLGLIELDEGALREAASRFSTVLELVGDDPDRAKARAKALLGLADVALARDDAEAARVKILESIDAYDQSFESWSRLARVEGQLGNEAAAAEARTRSETLREQLNAAQERRPEAPPAGRPQG